MRCRRKLIESGETKIPRTCQECGLFSVCPHYPYTPKPTPEQQIQPLETRVEELGREKAKLSQFFDKEPMRLKLLASEWIKSHDRLPDESLEDHQARKAKAMGAMEAAIDHKCMEAEELGALKQAITLLDHVELGCGTWESENPDLAKILKEQQQ